MLFSRLLYDFIQLDDVTIELIFHVISAVLVGQLYI
jgi:hypothetical protein